MTQRFLKVRGFVGFDNPIYDVAEISNQTSRSPDVACVRYAHTRSLFSLQPQPTACVPGGTHPTDGFKGRLKKRSRGLFHLPCDKKLPEKFLLLIFWPLFSDDRLRFYFAQAV